MRIPRIAPSEITPEEVFLNRRSLLGGALAVAAAQMLPASESAGPDSGQLTFTRNAKLSVTEAPTKYDDITHYNNFYEFGTDKESPAREAGSLRPSPWSVTIDGEAEVKGKFALEDILKANPLEERIYRLRCVEAWSMVVPWVGFPLSALLARFKPTSKAKYVAFTTLFAPARMPGQQANVLPWPYVEGLRIDEAMNPLTLMVVGLYGKTLPNQDGAPLRLIVPWKYGFKSIKSIVKVSFVERQPPTTWNIVAPDEYGFYANVNPDVDHPRWSQATERKIGGSFLSSRQKTLPFNGYAEQVASLYTGMDLRRYF